MKEAHNEIPEDIILRLNHDFDNEDELKEAHQMINHIRQGVLNVGWVQLSRAIILLSDGNINEMKKIIESNYYGDPRDVIMAMMSIPGNSNNHGMTPFKVKK